MKERKKQNNFILLQDQDFFVDKTASQRYMTNTHEAEAGPKSHSRKIPKYPKLDVNKVSPLQYSSINTPLGYIVGRKSDEWKRR
jgi:hypothetical protein